MSLAGLAIGFHCVYPAWARPTAMAERPENQKQQTPWQFILVDPNTLQQTMDNAAANASHQRRSRKQRVLKACVRCRKQKLRVCELLHLRCFPFLQHPGRTDSLTDKLQCDTHRPCVLCVRSDAPCLDAEPLRPRRHGGQGNSIHEEGMSRHTPTVSAPGPTSDQHPYITSPEWQPWDDIAGPGNDSGQPSTNIPTATDGNHPQLRAVVDDANGGNGADNVAAPDDADTLHLGDSWDWNAGSFLPPALWPRR